MPTSILHANLDHLELAAALFDAYRSFYGQSPNLDGARKFIRSRLSNEDSVILLAVDEKLSSGIGFVQLYPSFSSVAMRPIWILNDLFVSSIHRRSGVGNQLMNAASKFARSTGAVRVDLATASDNIPAKTLYESIGYEKDAVFQPYKLQLS